MINKKVLEMYCTIAYNCHAKIFVGMKTFINGETKN